jgi:hypothetical protein
MDLAPFANRTGRLETRLLDDVPCHHHGRRSVGQRPAAVFLDADGDRFVPRPVEIREDRRRRRQRHLVLAGTAAVQHTNT